MSTDEYCPVTTDAALLAVLARAERAKRVLYVRSLWTELAALGLTISESCVTFAVDRLCDRGWVSKRPRREGSRVYHLVCLTKRGRSRHAVDAAFVLSVFERIGRGRGST